MQCHQLRRYRLPRAEGLTRPRIYCRHCSSYRCSRHNRLTVSQLCGESLKRILTGGASSHRRLKKLRILAQALARCASPSRLRRNFSHSFSQFNNRDVRLRERSDARRRERDARWIEQDRRVRSCASDRSKGARCGDICTPTYKRAYIALHVSLKTRVALAAR